MSDNSSVGRMSGGCPYCEWLLPRLRGESVAPHDCLEWREAITGCAVCHEDYYSALERAEKRGRESVLPREPSEETPVICWVCRTKPAPFSVCQSCIQQGAPREPSEAAIDAIEKVLLGVYGDVPNAEVAREIIRAIDGVPAVDAGEPTLTEVLAELRKVVPEGVVREALADAARARAGEQP